MKVAIIGAGIGGLALGCGLRRSGIEATVYERDGGLGDTGGYHLHLHSRALDALRSLLVPEVLEQIYGSSTAGDIDLTTAMRDHRARRLATLRGAEDGRSINIDRATLLRLLAHQVGDSVRWGATCLDHAATPGGGAVVRFVDGSTVHADVVVGADGARSAVAEQLSQGRVASRPVGLVGVGGVTPASALSTTTAELLGTSGSNFALGPRRTALYVGFHDPIANPVADVALWEPPATREATYIFGAMLGESPASLSLLQLSGRELGAATARQLSSLGWSPDLTAVIANTAETSLAAFRLRSADPEVLAPWAAGPVCAIGDAVHAVPPTGGQGAATAILDAQVLCDELTAAARGDKTVAVAVHDFSSQMRTYAQTAVNDSLKPVTWMERSSTRPGRIAMRTAGVFADLRRGVVRR